MLIVILNTLCLLIQVMMLKLSVSGTYDYWYFNKHKKTSTYIHEFGTCFILCAPRSFIRGQRNGCTNSMQAYLLLVCSARCSLFTIQSVYIKNPHIDKFWCAELAHYCSTKKYRQLTLTGGRINKANSPCNKGK